MEAYVALGANLDDPAAQVERAIAELARLPRTRLTARSALYLSEAEGYTAQPDFVNAVAALDTTVTVPEPVSGGVTVLSVTVYVAVPSDTPAITAE